MATKHTEGELTTIPVVNNGPRTSPPKMAKELEDRLRHEFMDKIEFDDHRKTMAMYGLACLDILGAIETERMVPRYTTLQGLEKRLLPKLRRDHATPPSQLVTDIPEELRFLSRTNLFTLVNILAESLPSIAGKLGEYQHRVNAMVPEATPKDVMSARGLVSTYTELFLILDHAV